MCDNTNARGIMRMVILTSRRIRRINGMRNRLKIHNATRKKIKKRRNPHSSSSFRPGKRFILSNLHPLRNPCFLISLRTSSIRLYPSSSLLIIPIFTSPYLICWWNHQPTKGILIFSSTISYYFFYISP